MDDFLDPADDFVEPHAELGDDPANVAKTLPLLGVPALDEPFVCRLHGDGRMARIARRDLRYRCGCTGVTLSLAEVYASQMHGEVVQLRSRLQLAVWWNRLFADAGVATFDLPRVTIRSERAAAVLRGFVLLQAIRDQDPRMKGVPVEFSKAFAAAWCGVPPTTVLRYIDALVAQGFLARAEVSDAKRRVRWRYRLTGKGLELVRPAHHLLVSTTTPQEVAA